MRRRPSSTECTSAAESCPSFRVSRRLSTARTWSQTATAPFPAEGVATTIGGCGRGPVESGTTTTVRRARFRASAVTTTAGRVFLISLPSVGSKLTHQPHHLRTDMLRASGPEAITGSGRGAARLQTILYRRRLPFGHFDCKGRVPALRPAPLGRGGVAVADFIGRKGLLQQPPDEFACVAARGTVRLSRLTSSSGSRTSNC